jgi:ribosomal protein L11 methyltransferase
MNDTSPFNHGLDKGTSGPCPDLYIYYFKGGVRPENEVFDSAFIGNWHEDGFSFLFFTRPAERQIENLLKRQPDLTFLDNYHMSYADWHGGELMPLAIGSFFIVPPWLVGKIQPKHKKEQKTIILDPGVVFGTGLHPTTSDCLQALEQACGAGDAKTVIDLGTGTGLTALAAAKLGCRTILAVDNNYLAVQTARRNIRFNRFQDRILAVQGMAENCIDIPADLMIANIHYDVMRHLVASPGFKTKKYFVLSGLLRSQAEDVELYLDNCPVDILNSWSQDGTWHTFLGKTI